MASATSEGGITRAPHQVWEVEQFTGRDPAGKRIVLSVYGRDASGARVLAKLWRFAIYRDSGATLIMDRLQQVEHEAYLTLMERVRQPGQAWTLWRLTPDRPATSVTATLASPAPAPATRVPPWTNVVPLPRPRGSSNCPVSTTWPASYSGDSGSASKRARRSAGQRARQPGTR